MIGKAVALLVLLAIPAVFYRAWALWMIVGWFFIDGWHPTYAQDIGLLLIWDFLRSPLSLKKTPEDRPLAEMMAYAVANPAMAVGGAYLFHLMTLAMR